MAYDPENPRKGFPTIASKFFGKKDGQKLLDFGNELRDLTDEDVDQLHKGLDNGTLTY